MVGRWRIGPRSGTTYFDHQDTLGTERMRTTYAGAVGSSYKSLPWGDGYVGTINSSGADQDNEHFAGLERDAESGTEHAEFRNYASVQGRWLAPDSYMGSYNFTNPQSMNRYAYALNNPASFVDPSGLDDCVVSVDDGCQTTGGGGDGGGGGDLGDGNPGYCPPSAASCGTDGPADPNSGYSGRGGTATAQCGVDPFCIQSGGIGPFGSSISNQYAYGLPSGETIYVGCSGMSLFDYSCTSNQGQTYYSSDDARINSLATQINDQAGWVGTVKGIAAF